MRNASRKEAHVASAYATVIDVHTRRSVDFNERLTRDIPVCSLIRVHRSLPLAS